MDQGCGMCKNTAHRRCTGEFAQKYLSGDAIKAKCGAPIFVEVIDRTTGEAASPDALGGLRLEVSHGFSTNVWETGRGRVGG